MYSKLIERLRIAQQLLGRPKLTLTEKIILSHLDDSTLKQIKQGLQIRRGESYVYLRPDRVAMQDASAQTALLQFYLINRAQSAVPVSIHCDHLIRAQSSLGDHDYSVKSQKASDPNVGYKDLDKSLRDEQEVYEFLRSCARKWGLDFWKPGSGIIHQIVLENYAMPGQMMLGTDSHTPNAGGLSMMAIGVGGADAVDVMGGMPWELKMPRVLGVKLTGKLNQWASPKDVILQLAGMLTVKGGTGYVIEYFGDGVESLSCTGMATMCNMGAEVGCTTSIFPFTQSMFRYLDATNRSDAASQAQRVNSETGYLQADMVGDQLQQEQLYDKVIEIDLSKVEPHVNGPFSPDLAIPISKLKQMASDNGWPLTIEAALIGSCTNSSYQDMSRAASIAKQAVDRGLQSQSQFLVTPGSRQIRSTIERDGQLEVFQGIGAQVLSNACGPCIGMWQRRNEIPKDQPNVILTSYNRNFRGRNDGNVNTMNFLASPEIVTAMSLAGRMDFNPITDDIITADGTRLKLQTPSGEELPQEGFAFSGDPCEQYTPNPSEQVEIDPKSDRLQLLQPFDIWNGDELTEVPVLVKVSGKCTTDHISAAGNWLKYKGHLENIAQNTLIGALNAFTSTVNQAVDVFSKQRESHSIPALAAKYSRQYGKSWIVVAEDNYGEGSAREHASLQPRYLGCKMIIAKSFARIHETNLKKQGVIPLTFANPQDYDKITQTSLISTNGLVDLLSDGSDQQSGTIELTVTDLADPERVFTIQARHSLSPIQKQYIKHGSALNYIRNETLV
ncbi:hypothetical protein MP228_008916 [Amoeboaphelidium protococcarum]|nr:hypothetical protein MP228_008916 [Amoeboaphelidium protococcarum]